ncbi:MAG: DNA alkylation repair protein [Winogradskyella sp.]|nr:DNA alkylation repair protein [Winogradskyella sp.]NNK39609.1 DNA alkylation repair protein [Winogradskyella sp.]
MSFITDLSEAFKDHSNAENAKAMQTYMKHFFPFFGIKADLRRSICKNTVSSNLTEVKTNIESITLALYRLNEREFHYCAMEHYAKFKKRYYRKEDIDLIKILITTNSHWDTVDFIAKHILGNYLIEFPEQKDKTIQAFSNAKNMWLNRSTLLFQLSYKSKTDADLLIKLCKKFRDSNEFFIQKAIGWALREYGKTNPEHVLQFVENTNLKPLSKREAIRRLI